MEQQGKTELLFDLHTSYDPGSMRDKNRTRLSSHQSASQQSVMISYAFGALVHFGRS